MFNFCYYNNVIIIIIINIWKFSAVIMFCVYVYVWVHMCGGWCLSSETGSLTTVSILEDRKVDLACSCRSESAMRER